MHISKILRHIGTIILITAVFLILILPLPVLRKNPVSLNFTTQTLLQFISSILSYLCAIIFLIRFFIFAQRIYLFLGLGFFINASFELSAGLILGKISPITTKSSLVSILFLSSKTILFVFLFCSLLFWKFFNTIIKSKKKMILESTITTILSIFIGVSIVYTISLLPLEGISFYQDWITHPPNLILSLLFLGILPFYYISYLRDRNAFRWSLFLLILMNFLSELYLSFSTQVLDYLFYMGYIFKLAGFLSVVIGIFFESFVLYNKERNLREELSIANKELKRIDELKSSFLSSVSHELRTPLAIVKESISQVIEGIGGKPLPYHQKVLKIAHKSASHLSELINDLLDLQKIEAGKLELKKEPIDVKILLYELYESFKTLCEKKGISLNLYLPEEPLFLYIDRQRFNQIFINLLSNAVKFTDEGEVEILATEAKDKVSISVKDTGRGIKEDEIHFIFDKFRQFGKDKEGTGLGLAICKELVKMHEGEIFVKSEWKEGTLFIVNFPNFRNDKILKEYLKDITPPGHHYIGPLFLKFFDRKLINLEEIKRKLLLTLQKYIIRLDAIKIDTIYFVFVFKNIDEEEFKIFVDKTLKEIDSNLAYDIVKRI